jgi:hypothetical protein
MNSRPSLNAGINPRWIALFVLFGSSLAVAGAGSEFDQLELEQLVSQHFPGYRIMSRNEFSPAIQAAQPEPAVVEGAFTHPETRGFAALIRSETEQRSVVGKTVYRFYDQKLIVCSRSACQEIAVAPITLPVTHYLIKQPAGAELDCFTEGAADVDTYRPRTDTPVVVSSDGTTVAWVRPDEERPKRQGDRDVVPCVTEIRGQNAPSVGYTGNRRTPPGHQEQP